MASRAFTARFMITCSICPGSAFTQPRSGASTVASSTSSPINRCEHLPGPGDHVVEIEDPGLQHLLPAEGEELAREPGRAGRGASDLVQILATRVRGPQILEQQLAVAVMTVSRLLKS